MQCCKISLGIVIALLDQKNLPIQPDWTGKLPTGLILQDVRLIPDMVKVIGGKLALKDIQTIYTEKIPLENITTDGAISVGLVLLPLVGLLSGGGWLDISLKYLGRSRIPWIPHALIDFLLLSQIRIFVSIRAIDAFVDV